MIVVIGMGIGGAACALALARAGLDYVVLEQAPKLGEVGAGLQMSPNASRIMTWLGLGEALREIAVEPQAHLFLDGLSGEELLRTPLGERVHSTFGSPYFHAHRADLLSLLTASGEHSRVRLDTRVHSVGQSADSVRVELESGEIIEADALIGADGIHSVVREQIFRPDPPKPSGCIAWRGLVPVARAREIGYERNSYVWMGPHRSAVMYYVRGGELFNWVGIGPFDQGRRESWSATASTADALDEYRGWYPQVRDLIEATDSLFVTSIADREPLPYWVDGRIALMGDAAHAMLPFHAQGAVQSIEDAWVLARCLELAPDDVPGALARYQVLRQPRATRVQQQSRAAEHTFHMSDSADVEKRNARFRKLAEASEQGFPPGQRWLFAYDAEKAVLGEDTDWQAMSW